MGKIGSFGLERPCTVEGSKRKYGHKEKGLWSYVWEFGPINDSLKLTNRILGLHNFVYARNGKIIYFPMQI